MNTTTSAGSPGVLRVAVHLLLAALPLLAISAHVFGLVTMNASAALLILPLAVAVVVMSVFSPRVEDRVIVRGFVWGMIACAVYDAFRLDTVYMLGWWADFIPTMGTWITGTPDDKVAGAVVGYLWRYVGDGGGIGIAFFVGAAMVGLHERSRRTVVLTAIGFAVFPVWSGLIATVAIAPRGQRMMFPLTATTLALSLIGHLIFGLIMGLGFWHSRSVQASWPWAPVGALGRLALPGVPAALEPASSLSFGVATAAQTRVRRRAAAPEPSFAPEPGPVVVPPPPAPGALPEQLAGPSLPLGHPSGPQPTVGRHSGAMPAVERPSGATPAVAEASASRAAAAPGTGSFPSTGGRRRAGEHPSGAQPALGATTGARPAAEPGSGSFPSAGGRRRAGEHPSGAQPALGPSTGSRRAAERPAGPSTGTTVVPRAAHTPPSGETMGPDTWELWQHQLATTVKGRRTHRWR